MNQSLVKCSPLHIHLMLVYIIWYVQNVFTAREDSQVFYSHTLSLVFLEYLAIKWFTEFVEEAREEGDGVYPVLCHIAGLYSVWCLYKHSSLLYEGEHCEKFQALQVHLCCCYLLQEATLLAPVIIS